MFNYALFRQQNAPYILASTMIDDDDSQLFRRSIGPVKRLAQQERVTAAPRKPAPKPRLAVTEDHAETADFLSDGGELLGLGDVLAYQRPGVQNRLMRRLRQGRMAIERDLDLHGYTVAQARQQLLNFLAQAQADGLHCVRIVHGKGYRSPEQRPILKSSLDNWLPQCPQVLAYCSALPAHGGTGAVYVLLRGT